MANMEKPNIKEMPLEEKWDRLHDFFTMDHAISYKTHKRLGTVNEWVDDTVEAYRNMMPRFMGPLAKLMGGIVGKLAPNISLKQALNHVLYSEQMMHDVSEFEISTPSDGEICIRFKNCNRLRRQREIVKKAGLGFDPREICEVEKLHLTHPRHPTTEMGIIPTDIKWEETGCVWTFKRQK